MSTLELEHIKHSSASSNNITLAADGSLTVDTSVFHVDATNNRVGIGTTTPSVDLDIVGASSRIKQQNSSGHQINYGLWDGSNYRIEGDANRPMMITSYNTSGDGIKMGISGGNHLNIVPGGYVKQPSRPFFFAYPGEGTGGHNATSEWTGGMGTHYDNGSNYSGARFTAPVTGYYFFIAWFQEETYYGSWNSPISIFWYKNGSYQFYYGNDNPGIQDAYSEMKIGNSVITYLAENDTFSAAVRTPNGSPSTEYNSGGVMGWLIA